MLQRERLTLVSHHQERKECTEITLGCDTQSRGLEELMVLKE